MRLKFIVSITASVLLLAGCIKERGVNFANQTPPVANTIGIVNQTDAAAYEISTTPAVYELYVSMNSTDNSNPGGTVTIVKDTSGIAAAGFEPLPDSAYQLVSPTATLASNGIATFQVKVFTNKISLTHNYAMGFSISSTSSGATIATNKQHSIISVGVKNKWDGVYKVTGTFSDVLNPVAFTGKYPLTFYLETTGATTDAVIDPNLNGGIAGHQFYNNGGGSYYGNFGLILTFDPATNKIVSVVNYYGQYTNSSSRGAMLDPTGVNAYDPATKTIKIKYFLMAPNSSTIRAKFDETWTYTGPRP